MKNLFFILLMQISLLYSITHDLNYADYDSINHTYSESKKTLVDDITSDYGI